MTATATSTAATPATAIVNEATPPPIQFNNNLRPHADTIVKIVPRCFNFGRTDRAADDMRRKKNILTNMIME